MPSEIEGAVDRPSPTTVGRNTPTRASRATTSRELLTVSAASAITITSLALFPHGLAVVSIGVFALVYRGVTKRGNRRLVAFAFAFIVFGAVWWLIEPSQPTQDQLARQITGRIDQMRSETSRTSRAAELKSTRGLVVLYVNAVRRNLGYGWLREAEELDNGAQDWAQELVDQDLFVHSSPDFDSRITIDGKKWRTFEEAVAKGQSGPSLINTIEADRNGNAAVLNDPAVQFIGVGLATTADRTIMVVTTAAA